MNCHICGSSEVKPFLSLGETALANSYLTEEMLAVPEKKFPLEVAFCGNCKLVQLTCVVPPELLFKHYLYVTSTSNTFRVHFTKYAEDVAREFSLGKGSLVVDIGSNDGLLLKGFQKSGVSVVGVEPADNLAELANKDGVETINDYFNDEVVDSLISSKGKADVVTANNVFAHTTTIHEIARNVKRLLKDEGVFVIEAAYFVNMLRDMTFDGIYHEHLFHYSLTPLDYFFRMEGMRIFRVQVVSSHGGSLRVFVKKAESNRAIDASVAEMLENEKKLGIHDFKTYEEFAGRVYINRDKLVKLVRSLKSQGKSIAGYGAPAKATTLLSFCSLGSDVIDYIVDDSPLKQNLYLPGMHIPIVSSEMLDRKQPDYLIILAWNFAEEIMKKTRNYAEKGVKFIVPVPEPVVA